MSTDAQWREFAAVLRQASQLPVDDVTTETLIVGDLGLDSLALAELGVALIEEFPNATIADKIDREWGRVTAGELFKECMSAARA